MSEIIQNHELCFEETTLLASVYDWVQCFNLTDLLSTSIYLFIFSRRQLNVYDLVHLFDLTDYGLWSV